MAINNDRNLLEQQILSNSGLKGKELENLKARLTMLSEQQLQAELSKSLSGNNKGEWYTGVMLEHNESVVMRNNHDQTTYIDDNGNEISELKDGDEVLERIIKSTDDKGNVSETTVTFSGGRPLTQTKTKNGNTTETTTYKYNDDADVPFVTVETKKADQSKVTTNVLEVDINGNFDNEDFIDRKTILLDGTENFVVKENGRLTENVKKIGKPEVTTVYNGDNIQDLDSKKLNRLKQNEVYYDGKGNTYVQINAGETAQIMADRINKKRAAGQPQVTAQQIIELNPNLVKKNGEFVLQKFENGVKGLGEVKVPGEFDANSPFIRTRQSIQKANNLANQAEIDKQIATKVTKNTDKKFAAELANNGFKPTRENAIFYNRFNALNPTQQQNVLSVIKYCKNQKITDPNKIKARILETFPEINLFDSGKVIPMNSSFGTPAFQRKNPVALETFLTETLKLDLKSETGAMVYERLLSLPQEALNKINAQNFVDLSKANFVEIAHRFEANGVDIRTRQEHQIENNSPRMKAEQEKRELRESASQNIALAYDNAINIIKQYQGNQGWINVGFYREKLGKLLSNINPTKINTCFDDVIKELEKEKKFAVGYLKGKSTNDKEFKDAFKKISGGVEYNEANMKAFLDVAQEEGADFNDEKYNKKFWNAYNKAFGVAKTDKNGKVYYEPQVVKEATSRTNFQQYVDGAGDIVLMLLGTEAIGKGVAWAGGKIISKVSPYVPKFLANAGSKTVMTIGSNNITVGRVAANMASQSASFTLWDASKNYINLKTKDIQYSGEAAEKEWEAYKEGNVESAKFGAFAGALNTTVVGKVINGTMKMFEKPIAKAIGKVGKSFEKSPAMTGSDVMKTFMLNQTPGALAKTAGTIAEIGGFTLYETANEVTKELLKKDENGEHHLPAELTENGLTSYLWDRLKSQAANLGEIKAISRLIFMHKGAIQEQARLMDENLAKCETLKNVQIKKTEINGREIFEVTMPDGNRKVANSVEEVIANCNVLMQLDIISNAMKEAEDEGTKTTPQGLNAEGDALIQKARKENPATVVEEKVRRQWQQSDLETPVPEVKVDLFNLDPNAGLKESAQNVENEVTSLIFKGKLNETLTQRYNEMGRVLTEISKKHSADIEALAKANPKNKQAVADGIVKILARELGMEGFEPPIVFENTNGADGGADWPNGRIVINENITNVKALTSMISHEFVHMLQFRDVLAQYGEQGLRDLIANDKSIPENEKEQHIQNALNNPYNQHLLQSYNFQKAQTGTVNDYLRRIYKDEFTNTVGPEDMPRYIAQAAEREAYSSQEKVDRGLDESNLEELSVGEFVPDDSSLAALRAKMKAKLQAGQDVSSNNSLNRTSEHTEDFEINSDGTITRKGVPAGISTMSDAEFATKGRELCRRSDGTESPAARALLEAVKNSELTKRSYDPNQFNLEEFKEMSRDYKGNMFDAEILGFAKEMVECIPKGKDDDLLTNTDSTIRNIIMFQLNYAKPEVRRWIVDATKKLMSNPHVRNGIVYDIIDSCTEGNSNDGYTFNQKTFDKIYEMFEKKTVDGYEQFPIKNREFTQDFTYSLMIAEIAKSAIRYETDASGKQIKYFDDIGFKICMAQPLADPSRSYVHYDITKDRETGEIDLHGRADILQNYIIQETERKHFQTEVEKREYNLRTYKYDTWIEHDKYAKPLRQLCMVDGKLDAQNCFAVDYMRENLGMWKEDIVKVMETCKNQNGVLDMTMLRLIKNDEYRYSSGIINQLKRLGQDINILYDENGHVNQETLGLLKKSSKAFCLSKINNQTWYDTKFSYDISQHYMVDGKIDLEKLKTVEAEIEDLAEKLGTKDLYSWYDRCTLSNLYNNMKADPQNAQQILNKAIKVGTYILNRKISDKDGKGLDLTILDYYASIPDDLCNVIKGDTWLEPFITGEPLDKNTHYDNLISRLKPEVKETLAKHGIDINYVLSAKENQSNKKTEISAQAQIQFEQAIESLDKTLATADISRGIELEYTKEQFDRDILEVIKDLSPARANDILNSYGLTLRNGKIEGVICEPKIEAPEGLTKVNQKIKQCINKFQHNRVTTQDPALNSLYTVLTTDFPEFAMLAGTIGKDGQRVDTTILKQMQTLINNPQYKTLSPKEQQMAKLVLMFRGFSEIDSTPDVIKKTFMIDNDGLGFNVTHKRYKSSEYAASILERFNLTESEKYALGDLVAHSGWSKEYNGGLVDRKIAVDETEDTKFDPSLDTKRNAQKVAVNTRFGTLKLSKLIEDVINPDNNVDIKEIEQMQKQVYQNMQVVNSVTAKDLEPYWETQIIDGVECQVIDLRKTKLPDDFYLMGHFTQHGVDKLYELLSNNNDKAFFSNSLIKPGSAKTFAGRTEGIISEFDNRNVAETYRMNIDSGFGKSYNTFVTTMAGKGCREVASHVKEKLNLTNEEYGLLMEQIVDIRLNELDDYYNIGGRRLSKQEIADAHNEAYESMLKSQGEQNEITILNQKPIAYAYSASRTYQGLCPFDMKNNPLKRIIIFP